MSDERPAEDNPDLADRALARRRQEDASLALPVLGVLLLVSPLLNIFVGPVLVFGLPAAYVYVFTVWAGLILLAFGIARRLARADERG